MENSSPKARPWQYGHLVQLGVWLEGLRSIEGLSQGSDKYSLREREEEGRKTFLRVWRVLE